MMKIFYMICNDGESKYNSDFQGREAVDWKPL